MIVPQYTIQIHPDVSVLHGNQQYRVESSFRQASFQAVKEKLLFAYDSLLYEYEKNQGYPATSVSAALHHAMDALLLLGQVEHETKKGQRDIKSIVGQTAPHAALDRLARSRQRYLDQRLIAKATAGDTSWFKQDHWARLHEIAPHLAPAQAGE